MFKKQISKSRKGFALIELIVVIVVIAILTLLAFPQFISRGESAKYTRDISNLSNVEKNLNAFQVNQNAETFLENEISEGDLVKAIEESKVISINGLISEVPEGSFKVVSEDFIKKTLGIKEKLGGVIYSNERMDLIFIKDGKGYSEKATGKAPVVEDVTSIAYQTSVKYLETLKPNINPITSAPINVGQVASDAYFDFNTNGTITAFYPKGKIGTLPEIKDLVIPEQISGVKVLYLSSTALKNKNLNSIYFPSGIKTIPGASLSQSIPYERIVLPSSMGTVISGSNPYAVFYGASVKELVIYKGEFSDYLHGLFKGYMSGYHGGSLSRLVVKDGVNTIPGSSFYGTGLKELILGLDVVTIGGSAFSSNALTEVVFPSGLTTIGGSAFSYNQISKIYLPAGVNVGASAFTMSVPLSLVVVPDSISNNISGGNPHSVFSGSNISNLVIYPGATSNSLAGLFKGYTSGYHTQKISNITLIDGVDKIPSGIFSDLGVQSLKLGKALVSIGSSAFSGNSINEIFLDETVTSIGSYAFNGNPIVNLTIPTGTNVGAGAFGYNTFLENVKIPNTINNPISPSNPDAVFKGSKIKKLTIYKGSGAASLSGVFKGYTSGYHVLEVNNVAVNDGVVNVPSSSFDGVNVQTLKLGKGLVSIGSSAFSGNQIKEIYLDESITTIGSYAFYANPIVDLKIPSGANAGTNAFGGNVNFNNVEIPNSISNPITTSNPSAVFSNSKIKNLTIYKGSGVPSLAGVFKGYTSGYHVSEVNHIIIKDGVTNIPSSTFEGVNVQSLQLGKDVTAIGANAFRSNKIPNLILPQSVNSVGSFAFYGNPILDLFIPANAMVGEGSFGGNSQYVNVKIPDSIYSAITTSTPYAVFHNVSIANLEIYKGTGVSSLSGVFNGYTSGYGANSISSIRIDDSISIINAGAINVGGLSKVEIPSGVTLSSNSMGNGFPAFYNSMSKASGIYERVNGSWLRK